MKKTIRFRDVEQASYSLIGFIPYLLSLFLVLYLDVEVTTTLLLVALAALVAHLIGFSVIRKFGRQLTNVHDVTAIAAMSEDKSSIEVNENTPDELVGIIHHFNTVLAESERSSRNFQEVTTKLVLYTREIERYQERLREEGVSRNRLSRYVDKSLVDKIINSETDTPLQNKRQKATILFADIRSFTAISEHMSPEEVIGMLNDYFDAMVKIIFKHNGVLDKFVGDELMATFGVIGDADEGVLNGLKASIEMQNRVVTLMSEFRAKGYPVFEVGMGVNYGDVVIGSVGSKNRMDYTVIGDTVNVAARLEQMAEGHTILVGESVFERCNHLVPMQPRGDIKVKNRGALVKCYQVTAHRKG